MRRITSYIRSNRRRCLVTAAAGLFAVGGGIGIGALTTGSPAGIETASAASPTTVTPPTTAVPANPAASGSGTAKTKTGTKTKARGVRGTITAISGSTWTLHTRSGRTVSVTISSSTRYGKRATPARLVVGANVVVVGPRHGDTVTAVEVGLGRAGTSRSSGPIVSPPSTTNSAPVQ